MIGGVFTPDRLCYHRKAHGSDALIYKAVIYMLVLVNRGIIIVKGGTAVVYRQGVYISEELCHLVISHTFGDHIEISYDKCGVLRNFLAVIVYKTAAVALSLVTETEMGIHNREAFPALSVF